MPHEAIVWPSAWARTAPDTKVPRVLLGQTMAPRTIPAQSSHSLRSTRTPTPQHGACWWLSQPDLPTLTQDPLVTQGHRFPAEPRRKEPEPSSTVSPQKNRSSVAIRCHEPGPHTPRTRSHSQQQDQQQQPSRLHLPLSRQARSSTASSAHRDSHDRVSPSPSVDRGLLPESPQYGSTI